MDLFLIIFRKDNLKKLIFKEIKSFNKQLNYIRYNFYDFPIDLIIKTKNQSILKEKLNLLKKKQQQEQSQLQLNNENQIYNYLINFNKELFLKLLEWKTIDLEIIKLVYKLFKNEIDLINNQLYYYKTLIKFNNSRIDILKFLLNQIQNQKSGNSNYFIKSINRLEQVIMIDKFDLSNEICEFILNYNRNNSNNDMVVNQKKKMFNENNEFIFWKVIKNKVLYNEIFKNLKSLNTLHYIFNGLRDDKINMDNTQSTTDATDDDNITIKKSIKDHLYNKSNRVLHYVLSSFQINGSKTFKNNFIYKILIKRNESEILEKLISKFHKIKNREIHDDGINSGIVINLLDYEIDKTIFNNLFVNNIDLELFKYSNSEFIMKLFKKVFKCKGILESTPKIYNKYLICEPELSSYIIGKYLKYKNDAALKKTFKFTNECYRIKQGIESDENINLFFNFMDVSLYKSELLNLNNDWLKEYIKYFSFSYSKLETIFKLGFENIATFIYNQAANRKTGIEQNLIKQLTFLDNVKLIVLALPSDTSNGNQCLFELVLPYLNNQIQINYKSKIPTSFYSYINDDKLPLDPLKRLNYLKNVNRITSFSTSKINYNFEMFLPKSTETFNSFTIKSNLIKTIPNILSSNSSSLNILNSDDEKYKNGFESLLNHCLFSNSFKILKKSIHFLKSFNFKLETHKILNFLLSRYNNGSSYTTSTTTSINSKLLLYLCKELKFYPFLNQESISIIQSKLLNNFNFLNLFFSLNNFKNFNFIEYIISTTSSSSSLPLQQQQQNSIKLYKKFISILIQFIIDLTTIERNDYQNLIFYLSNSNFNLNNLLKPELYKLFIKEITPNFKLYLQMKSNSIQVNSRFDTLQLLFNFDLFINNNNNNNNEDDNIISNNKTNLKLTFKKLK